MYDDCELVRDGAIDDDDTSSFGRSRTVSTLDDTAAEGNCVVVVVVVVVVDVDAVADVDGDDVCLLVMCVR
jgi:hypothetical protein